ncbi:MAG: hypothetical protein LBN43_09265 [Oscillospiraceae bacterium]|nr:hypothetical protein [Oscillospiraceae bacterium]
MTTGRDTGITVKIAHDAVKLSPQIIRKEVSSVNDRNSGRENNSRAAYDALTRNHIFIISPTSFRKSADMDSLIQKVNSYFGEMENAAYAVFISRYQRSAIGIIRNYVRSVGPGKIVRVYAVGDSSIMFDCLNGIVGLDNTELAVIPYGARTDFIRVFGENQEALFRNIELQATSPTVTSDILHCGSNYALSFCLIGLESLANATANKLIHKFSRACKMFPKLMNILFYYGGLCSVFNNDVHFQRYILTIDGEVFTSTCATINIANVPYYGGDKGAIPEAVPDDGWLDVLYSKTKSLLATLGVFIPYMMGKYKEYPQYFVHKRAREISIRSDLPLMLDLDGEVFFDTNINIKIIPQGVKIVSPGGMEYIRRLPNE